MQVFLYFEENFIAMACRFSFYQPNAKHAQCFYYLLLSLLISTICFSANAQSSVLPQNLRCEYLINPEGIDESSPRLSWELTATNPKAYAQKQTAYNIIVSNSLANINANKGDVWESGWITSDAMAQIVYAGSTLASDKKYYWKVAVKDEAGKVSAWSTAAHWSMGLLQKNEWTAKWIGTTDTLDKKLDDCNVPDPWFRKTITLDRQPAKATMFVASVGYHELYVNGKKIGDEVLAPCVSDHSKRARYIAYDIAAALKPGKNTIAIWLGASWSIYPPYYTSDKPTSPIVIAQADLYDNEKSTTKLLRIQTDDSWITHPSPNKLLGKWFFWNMGGEIWDANKEIPDWNLASCNTSNWKQATVYHPEMFLSAQMVEGNKLFHEIHPIGIEKKADGSFRVDMGVNFTGWTSINVNAAPNTRVDFLFSERDTMAITFRNHSAYITGASGKGVFHNRFNYGAGRWITIRGLKTAPKLTDIKGWVVRTNYTDAGSFVCSDSLQNWIYNTVRWNYENLSLGGYVVDCSQRERMGYGGDAHATSETGVFNYRLGAFYTKWMEDWRDVQGNKFMDSSNYGGNADEGILPHTAPTYWGGGGPGWGGICITLPWLIYQQEGDTRILDKNFNLIKKWLAFLDSHTHNDLMERFGAQWDFLGDWLWPNAGVEGMNNGKPQNICFNNCYRVYNLRTAAKIARIIGDAKQAASWEQQAEASSNAIHAKYFNAADNSYSDSSMGNLAMALLAGVPPANLQAAVMNRLQKEILEVRKGHVHVGITAGAALFKLLREQQRDDLLYSMTSQTTYPGWGYMKANGATSIWEMWEKDLPGHSLLHSSYLYPGAWYIDGMGGIRRNPSQPGFRDFIIRVPSVDRKKITWAKASYHSPAGFIKTSWQQKDGKLQLSVTVPPNTKATVYFPGTGTNNIQLSSSLIQNTGAQDGYVMYSVPAGNYVISSL